MQCAHSSSASTPTIRTENEERRNNEIKEDIYFLYTCIIYIYKCVCIIYIYINASMKEYKVRDLLGWDPILALARLDKDPGPDSNSYFDPREDYSV